MTNSPGNATGVREAEVRLSSTAAIELGRRRRLLGSILLAALALVALSWILHWVAPADAVLSARRSSFSFRADGFRGAYEVLARLGFRVERHRLSYGRLPPPEESVLMLIDPLATGFLESIGGQHMGADQVRALEEWIERGGRIVAARPGVNPSMLRVLGAEFPVERREPAESRAGRTVLDAIEQPSLPALRWIEPAGRVEGEGELAGFSAEWAAPPPGSVRLAPSFLRAPDVPLPRPWERDEARPVLAAFADDVPAGADVVARLDGAPLVFAAARGSGRIWTLSSAHPFTNLGLGLCGTAPLVVALADLASEGGRRALYFDEYAHGLWPRGGLFAWVRRSGLLAPALCLVCFAGLLAWRGAIRLGPPREERSLPRRAKEEFVISLADIARRARKHRAAARWIVETYRHRLAGRSGAGEGDLAALAERIAGPGRLDAMQLEAVAAEAGAIDQRARERGPKRGPRRARR